MLPCCHLQDVIDKMTEEDTISLIQPRLVNMSICKPRKVNATVSKSMQIRTGSFHGTEKSGVQNVHLEIDCTSTKPCSLALIHSHLYCSRLSVQNMDVLIENTTFTNSYLDFTSDRNEEVDIKQTEFSVSDEEISNAEHAEYGIAKVLQQKAELTKTPKYYIKLFGTWRAVKLSYVNMLGNGSIAIHGITATDGQIHSINMFSVTMSRLASVLTTDPSLHLTRVHVQESIFTGNGDGIYLENSVMNLLLLRSVFERTAPWKPDPNVDSQCSRAVRATVVSVQIQDSSFRQNRAVGKYCTGSALSINMTKISGQYGQEIDPGVSTSMTTVHQPHHMWDHPLVEIANSFFTDNAIEECYVDYWESDYDFKLLHNGTSSRGGAIAIHGSRASFKVYNATFIGNKGCQGAGLHISLLDIKQTDSFIIDIFKCTFAKNQAYYGAGFMLVVFNMSLGFPGSFSVNLQHSNFIQNLARSGAGIFLYLENTYLAPSTLMSTTVHSSTF